MKTLPHLKQFTYAAIILSFPFVFSASKDTKMPKIEKVVEKKLFNPIASPQETLRILKSTADSLKNSTATLTQVN